MQDWLVRRQLLGTPGVADVSSFGGFVKQYEVGLDPERLRSFNVTVADVYNALTQNNQNTGGTYIDKNPAAFAVLMVVAATSMIRSKQAEEVLDEELHHQHTFNYSLILTIGLVVGTLTGFVGAGGGFLIVPALVLGARLPMKLAVGTSLTIIALNSLIGFSGNLSAGTPIAWTFLLGFLTFALGGIVLGTYLARFIPGAKLKPAFGWFTLAMGTFILTKELLFHHS